MGNFRRALKDAMRYWPSLTLATLCSIAVAALWGGNIAAFYPILEITLKNQSMHQWLDGEVIRYEEQVATLQAKREVETAGSPSENAAGGMDTELLVLQNKLASYKSMRPWIERYVPRSPFNTVAAIVGILLASTLIKHAFLVLNELLVGRVAIDISRNLRMKIFDKALHIDRATFSYMGMSKFTAHITHTTEMLSQGLMNTLGGAVREPMKILSCLIAAGMICWRLLLISLVVAPVVGFLLVWITRKLKKTSRDVLMKSSHFHEVMLESLGNVQTVQSYCMEHRENERFAASTAEMKKNGLKFILYTALTKPVIEFLGLGMLCTTIVVGSYLVLNHQTTLFGITVTDEPLSVTAMLIFFGLLVGASDPLRKLSMVYSSIYTGTVAANSLYPLLDQQSTIRDPEVPVTVPTPHKLLKVDHITFAYRMDQSVLKDVSLDIPFGSTIAIVGQNGTGKSTLINLLCRFYDPSQGAMRLDGVDLRHMRLADLRSRLAIVSQNTELFNETVEYNIAYGTLGATHEQIVQAAKEAHAHEFIDTSLPEKYQTRVGQNGHRLSGGQRQRIALARALLRQPEILILDEATSQIDMYSELLIRDSLEHHRGKRTMIIITHRQALLELADVVYEVRDHQLKPGSSATPALKIAA